MTDWNQNGVDQTLSQQCDEIARLTVCIAEQQDEIERLRASVHPRVWKLVEKGRDFIVIGEHEPYYLQAYALIREHEMSQGTWTERDRICYGAAQLAAE